MLSSLLALVALAASVPAQILYAGVSESSGEFGVYSPGNVGYGLPGRFGTDYAFINEAAVDILVDNDKINVFRVAFLLERMCPLATGLGSTFNETHFTYYKDAIDYITVTKGAYALLDPHNYMRYNDPSSQPTSGSIIGDTTDSKAATTAQFQEFWTELASRFVDNPNVIFGIMNEPHDMSTALILENDQAAITGIRSAGAKQLILAPGNGYTGGHSWTTSAGGDPSSDYLYQIQDPINNTAIDIHEYLDVDYSGSHVDCTQAFPTNLAPLTSWLNQYKLKAFVSEFGGSNTTTCDSYLDTAIDYMSNNSNVYIGWSAWAAGPFWGVNSPCCTGGATWGSLEPGSVASDGSPSLYTTVFEAVIKPKVPTSTLKKSGTSSLS